MVGGDTSVGVTSVGATVRKGNAVRIELVTGDYESRALAESLRPILAAG